MRGAGFVLPLLVSAVAVVASAALLILSDTALYDTNYAVFERLDPADRVGIFHTAAQLAKFQLFLLVATNLLWAVGVGATLRHRRPHSSPAERLAAAVNQDGPDR